MNRCEHKDLTSTRVEKRPGVTLRYAHTHRCKAAATHLIRQKPGYFPWPELCETRLCDAHAAAMLAGTFAWEDVVEGGRDENTNNVRS